MARLEMTSLAFMLVWVPLPVCQMRKGNSASSCALDDLVGGADDEFGFFGRHLAEFVIGFGGGFFEDADGADDRTRHQIVADGKMNQRAGGLRAPVMVGGDLDSAHAVGFGASLCVGGHGGKLLIEI